MARFELSFKASVAKDLRGRPKAEVQRALRHIEALRDDPRVGARCGPGCEKLAGAGEHYRVRQGNWRIVYGIEGAVLVVEVVRIGHRREVYRRG